MQEVAVGLYVLRGDDMYVNLLCDSFGISQFIVQFWGNSTQKRNLKLIFNKLRYFQSVYCLTWVT